jgi:hypothetical protein
MKKYDTSPQTKLKELRGMMYSIIIKNSRNIKKLGADSFLNTITE